MQLPSADRTHELFWRQAVRWISAAAPDAVTVGAAPALVPGSTAPITVDVRGTDFGPIGDAEVRVRITTPAGTTTEAGAALADPGSGRYSTDMRFEDPGIYRVTATATRSGTIIGTSTHSFLVGGADLEMADPRLNEDVLRRVAAASGGGYLRAGAAQDLSTLFASAGTDTVAPRLEDLWQTPWVLVAVILLLGTEWTLRRKWGLR